MNLRPRKQAELDGMLRHDFRRYGPEALPAHIEPERQARKIRKDANVVASLVCTLPKEIAPDDTAAVDAWVSATLNWLRKQCPGQLAYAVLHQDESRPHIHAAVIPVDGRGVLPKNKSCVILGARPSQPQRSTMKQKYLKKGLYVLAGIVCAVFVARLVPVPEFVSAHGQAPDYVITQKETDECPPSNCTPDGTKGYELVCEGKCVPGTICCSNKDASFGCIFCAPSEEQ